MSITFDDGLASVYSVAMQVLDEVNATATVFAISDLVGKHYLGRPLMDGRMLRSLVTKGWEIGSHTRTHSNLRKLSIAQIRSELKDSKKRLYQITLSNVDSLAYPFGSFDARVKTIAGRYYSVARAGSSYPPLRKNSPNHCDAMALNSVSTMDNPIYLMHHLFENYLSVRFGSTRIRQPAKRGSADSRRRGLEARFVKRWLQSLQADQWLILNFHDICESSCSTAYSTSLEEFRAIVRLGRQFSEIVPLLHGAESVGLMHSRR